MERLIAKKAPFFTMEAVSGDGEDFFTVSLDDYKGSWLILFFYPMDFTFVCPTELTGFDQDYQLFQEAGAKLLAVSTDSKYCHQTWIRSGLGRLHYPIGADKTMSVSSEYGVLLENEGIALRGLFIIDPHQIVRYSVIHDNNVGRNTQEILRILKALQTNGLCGANWTVGSKNLAAQSIPENHNKKPVSGSAGETGQIRIYTLPDCSYCRQIKNYLDDKGMSYAEINLKTDEEGQAFMNDRGYTALPVTVIGSHEISGFRLDKIKEILES